jgi:hypothetical protein
MTFSPMLHRSTRGLAPWFLGLGDPVGAAMGRPHVTVFLLELRPGIVRNRLSSHRFGNGGGESRELQKNGLKTMQNSRSIKAAARALLLTVLAASAAGLAGCSETMTSVSVPPFSQLMRGYDDTLTAEQQKAAIAELQKERDNQPAAK